MQVEGAQSNVLAPEDGVFEPQAELGQEVREGDLVGRILFPLSSWRTAVDLRFEVSGFVICRRAVAWTRRGDGLFQPGARALSRCRTGRVVTPRRNPHLTGFTCLKCVARTPFVHHTEGCPACLAAGFPSSVTPIYEALPALTADETRRGIARALDLQAEGVVAASSGNAGASLATYAGAPACLAAS